jgi:membrane dipeptidase
MEIASLHRQSILIDAHCDTLLAILDGERSLLTRSDKGHLDLPRLQEVGMTAQVFALFVPDAYAVHAPTAHALRMIYHLYASIEQANGQLILARTAADIDAAHANGQVAAILGMEGAEPLDGSLEIFHIFHRLGLRVLGLTWNRRNAAADGLDCARSGGGLTPFGEALVRACNEVGVIIDIAHLAPAGVRDVLDVSIQPIIASHANARALCDHPRNLTDEQIAAIAARGGVIGATFVPDFITRDRGQATLERFLDHVDYLLAVAGPDHVALGSDFDGMQPSPEIASVVDLPKVTAGLLARGHAVEVVQKILGGNWLRVFRQVWPQA